MNKNTSLIIMSENAFTYTKVNAEQAESLSTRKNSKRTVRDQPYKMETLKPMISPRKKVIQKFFTVKPSIKKG